MRTKILAGNWKMNLGPAEAAQYFAQVAERRKGAKDGVRAVIFPPAYCLTPEVNRAAHACAVELGAQNVHWEEKGAFTGELSGAALKAMGISWVLIGHSERRQFFAETDETAAKRLARAIALDLNVVFCLGELLAERESGQTEQVLARQCAAFIKAAAGAHTLKVAQPKSAVVSLAYEPVWAIGTGKTATVEQAEQAHRYLRKLVWDELGLETAQKLPILYGGSVTPENAASLLAQPNVDGVLVGGASLKPESFAQILASV